MQEPNEDKPQLKENVWGAWLLILALLVIPVVVKFLFFPDL